MRSTRAWAGALSIAVTLALTIASCAKRPAPPPPPPPDSDGTPQEAYLLRFGERHPDTIDRAGGDLDDWYRIEVNEPGSVRIALGAPQAGTLPNLTLALTDASGVARVEPTRSGGRARVEFAREVESGSYLVWVGTEPEAVRTGAVPYTLEAAFLPRPPPPPPPVVRKKPSPKPLATPLPPPPPPPPSVETVETTLVEVERPRDEGQFAMIKGGSQLGFRPGLRGRFVDGGRTVGTFEVIEVYAGGSRVKIEGRPSGPLSGRTSVQVDVPTGP